MSSPLVDQPHERALRCCRGDAPTHVRYVFVLCSRNDVAMSETWYPLALRVGGRTLFLLWDSDDWALNRVLADAGRVVSFSDEESAREYALAENLTLAPKEELHLHDLDSAVCWLEADAGPDCSLLLAIWNLAGDVARSVNEPFEDRGEGLDEVYNKLFFGNNLPSMTPPGEQYNPQWTEDELGLLRARIEMAVDLIRDRVVAPG
jgi:hypothetical protein